MKSDHFVGKYYVLFETVFQKEFTAWLESAQAQEEFGKWQASSGGKTTVQKAQKYRIVCAFCVSLLTH